MSALLKAEALKLRTTRTFIGFVAAALGLSLLFAVLGASLSDDLSEQDARDLALTDLSSLFILLLAVVATAGEWRHRTIASTVLAAPDRARLLLAKIVAYAAAGTVLSLIVLVAVYGITSLVIASRDFPTLGFGDFLGELPLQLLHAAYFGAIGVAIGVLVRNQPGALVLVLVVLLFVEPTLSAIAPDVARFGPLFGAPNELLNPGTEEGDLSRGAAGAVMAAWLVGLCGAAIATLRQRDLS
jgi:ABC-type transport system involved in multi-copper enzyme maturation permease subunit